MLLEMRKKGRTRRVAPGPPIPGKSPELQLFHRLPVCPALTLALAVVLGFGGATAALAFTRVLAFTGVLFFCFLVGLLILISALILSAERRLHAREQIRSLNACSGSREQARDRRASNQVFI